MTAVVHLVWGPLGPSPLREFLRSYRGHPVGADHELAIVFNGVDAAGRSALLAELEGVKHRLLELPAPVPDLAAYGHAAQLVDHDLICFLNSYSIIESDGWLGHLAGALYRPGVGLAGATGSWESQAEWMRGKAGDWPRQLLIARSARREYPRFPNPHIRTTAFIARRSLIAGLNLQAVRDKHDAYLLESGFQSITRQFRQAGLRAVVVGRDGIVYDVEDWAVSGTYRGGGQRNLLVSDNRTNDWRMASSRMRRRLTRDAWGAADPVRLPALRRTRTFGPWSIRSSSAATVVPAASTARLNTPPAARRSTRGDSPPRDASAADSDGAIVIVNYRSSDLVERCLASVKATSGALRLEMIVVDNASHDGSVERLNAALPGAKVVEMSENRGFAAGVNAGFQHTTAELVIVLNPDTEMRGGAIQALLRRLRSNREAGVVAPLLEDRDGRLTPNGYRRFPNLLTIFLGFCVPMTYALSYAPGLHPDVMSPAALLAGSAPVHVTGAALAIRREAYEQAGPLDEGFFLYLEETEWQRRVARCGWAIEIEPHARICHLVRGGGEAADTPPPDFVTSALRYLHMQGVPVAASRSLIAVALASSWLSLRLIACLPAKRARAIRQAHAYRTLLRGALGRRSIV